MSAQARTKMNVGLVGFSVELHKATMSEDDDSVGLKRVCGCGCGAQPKMRIVCPKGTEYTAWQGKNAPPLYGWRGSEPEGRFQVTFPVAEVEAAAEAAGKHKELSIEKVTSLSSLALAHDFGPSYYLIPDRDASPFEVKAYTLFVEALAGDGWVLLTRFSHRTKAQRLAIVADAARGVLLARPLLDLRELPREPRKVPVTEAERGQVKAILQGSYAEDPTFAAEEDPKKAVVMAKLRAAVDAPLAAALAASLTPAATTEAPTAGA